MGVGARNVEGWLVACARAVGGSAPPTQKKGEKKNKAHKAKGGNMRRVSPRDNQVQLQKKRGEKEKTVVAAT
jgi:hypothetical protein